MHTITVIAGGLALLAACLLVARLLGASSAKGALAFLPLWLAAALVNMWVGVTHAGYTVAQEFPILLVVFGIPAAAALLVRQRWPAV